MTTIHKVSTRDVRIDLHPGEGSDAIHSNPQYSYAVTLLATDKPGLTGVGLAFTLGGGNDLVCAAAKTLADALAGREIEELMADFGRTTRELADHHQLRWLGPHKGVVHLALASVVNACFDLWAKSRGVPLWRLLLDLSPEALVATLDLSYLEDVLTADEARRMIAAERPTRASREGVIARGYPGYDTSVGWFNYSDEQVRTNARKALDNGFTAMKLKVGSKETARDVRRASIVREVVGPDVRVMVDANQQWTLPVALRACLALAPMNPYWVEEPTHPDDVAAHQTLARAIAPIPIAMGEHVPNRVVFKNYMQAQAAKFIQVDAVRVAGVSEFIVVSLMARQHGLIVVPHVGDMGQIHQHLVLFNHVGLGLDRVFLEYIPHLRDSFVHPAVVEGGVYKTPMEAGSSSDLK
ncbi:MAG: mandelate racemase [Planctomycetota bacterium]|nr:mandelate racemase [Planctomycetota bacterium]